MDRDGNSINSEPNNGIPATHRVTTNRKRSRRRRLKPEQWIAILGGTIIPIIVALIPVLAAKLQPSPTPTFNPTSTTVFITDTPTATQTLTSTPTFISSPTFTDVPAASITPSLTIEPSPATRVFVVLVANKNTGRPPLNIRLDARDSYLLEPNGTRLSCRGGPCFYTWSVYSGGQQIGNAENNSIGTFDYSFGKNGTYTVTVVVCRGRNKIDCAGSGTQIVVSR